MVSCTTGHQRSEQRGQSITRTYAQVRTDQLQKQAREEVCHAAILHNSYRLATTRAEDKYLQRLFILFQWFNRSESVQFTASQSDFGERRTLHV